MPELEEFDAQGHQLRIVPMLPRGRTTQDERRSFVPVSLIAPLCSFAILRDFLRIAVVRPCVVVGLLRRFSSGPFGAVLKNLLILPKSAWLSRQASDWGADHIHAYWASGPASMALAASEMSGIPWSFSAHRYDILGNPLMQQKAELARFARFICADGRRLSGLEGTPAESKSIVLHLGIDVNVDSVHGTPAKLPLILCVAALIPRKGHDVLLRAMRELKRRGVVAELWLVGDGELRKRVEARIRAYGLDEEVRVVGSLSHSEIMCLYERGLVTAIALASEHEGIPVCLMEAMSFAVPVVATKTGGIPELLSGGAGLTIVRGDWLGMANALQQLIEDVDLRTSVGNAGRERVRKSFAAPQTARIMAALMSGILLPQDVDIA